MANVRICLVLAALAPLPSNGYSKDEPQACPSGPAKSLAQVVSEAMDHAFAGGFCEMDLILSMHGLAGLELLEQIKSKGGKLERSGPTKQLSGGGQRKIQGSGQAAGGLGKETPMEAVYRELAEKGSAAVFASQRAKFRKHLQKETFSEAQLTMIYLDIRSSAANKQFHSYPLFMNAKERKLSPTGDQADAGVLCFLSMRPTSAKDKVPVIAHCSFVFMAVKEGEGKGSIKTLSFDLYLDELKRREGVRFAYPWKLKDVRYK